MVRQRALAGRAHDGILAASGRPAIGVAWELRLCSLPLSEWIARCDCDDESFGDDLSMHVPLPSRSLTSAKPRTDFALLL